MIKIYNRYGNSATYQRTGETKKHLLPECPSIRDGVIKRLKLEDARREQEEILRWLQQNPVTHPDWEWQASRLSVVDVQIERLEFRCSEAASRGVPDVINFVK